MLFNDELNLLYDDIVSMPPFPEIDGSEINNINNQLHQLTIDLNTQSLQLQIEKDKGQKINTKLKSYDETRSPTVKLLIQLLTNYKPLCTNTNTIMRAISCYLSKNWFSFVH